MKSLLKFEWQRLIHSRSFLLAMCCAALIVSADAVYQFVQYLQGVDVYTSVFYKWLGVNDGFFVGHIFYLTLPLLTAIAYSWTGSYDRNTGYIVQIVSRSGRRQYFLAKFLVSFVSGGMVFAGALLLNFMLLALFSPAYEVIPADLSSFMDPLHFCSGLFYHHTYLFMLLWLMTAFLWGGAMACIGTAAGMCTKKHLIVGIVPFLVFLAEQILGGFFMQRMESAESGLSYSLIWTDLLCAGSGAPTESWFVLLNIAVIVAVSAVVYVLRSKDYECL